MLCKTRGIVLHAIPYNDKYSIIHIYTEEFGRVSYLVGKSRGKRSSVSKALFMPLSILEMEVEHLNKRDIHRIKESRLCFPINNICIDPIKNLLALFLSEVLYRTLRETGRDERLFGFLYEAIHLLEYADSGVANFHIIFLLSLPSYLGIFPNTDSYRDGYYFDMMNGEFTEQPPLHSHYLNKEESRFFSKLLRMSFGNMSLYSFSRGNRTAIIERILEYYRLHIPDFPEIKSLSVLKSIFD